MEKIIIGSEDDAWKILQWLEGGGHDDDEPLRVEFRGWPSLDLHYRGEDFYQSVPTRIMPALLKAQTEINRLYCQLHYGEQNLKRLSQDDRARLELVVIVKKGSSNFVTPLQNVFNELVKNSVSNMTSEHILIAILGLGLLYTSQAAWKHYLESKAKERDIDSNIKMSELEMKKIEVVARALNKVPAVSDLAEGVDEFKNHSLSVMKPSDKLALSDSDVNVDGHYAAQITHMPRAESKEKRIDGDFLIRSVDSGGTKGFRLKVERVIDGGVFTVSIPEGTLGADQKEILKTNEWAKKPVRLEINAKELRGQITSATLVSASKIDKSTSNKNAS